GRWRRRWGRRWRWRDGRRRRWRWWWWWWWRWCNGDGERLAGARVAAVGGIAAVVAAVGIAANVERPARARRGHDSVPTFLQQRDLLEGGRRPGARAIAVEAVPHGSPRDDSRHPRHQG